MNRTVLVALLLAIGFCPAYADEAEKSVRPAVDGVAIDATSNAGPVDSGNGAAPLRGTISPSAALAPTHRQSPLDYGASPRNPSTPFADSLHTPVTAPSSTSISTTVTTSRPVANLSANLLSATAKLLDVTPLMRCRDENLRFVEVTLHNDSTEVALVHGDIAEAKVGDNLRTAASARYIGSVAQPKLNTKGRVYTGLVLAGSWGLAGPIFYELVTPNEHRLRYLGRAIGVDGSRHEIEDQRFGLRVLMPGEETVGWLAFECPPAINLTSLLIPVNYSKSALPSGSLYVPVVAANATGPMPASSTSLPPGKAPHQPRVIQTTGLESPVVPQGLELQQPSPTIPSLAPANTPAVPSSTELADPSRAHSLPSEPAHAPSLR